MEIKGKVHCLFEQSATFRDEFRKIGYDSFDYDIQNSFGKTDYQIDLFAEIEKAYDEEESIFNNITKDDLIIAFFPCIYFEAMQANYYQMACNNLYGKDKEEQYRIVLERINNRNKFYILLYRCTRSYNNSYGHATDSYRRAVCCIYGETAYIFNSIKEASVKMNIPSTSIFNALKRHSPMVSRCLTFYYVGKEEYPTFDEILEANKDVLQRLK